MERTKWLARRRAAVIATYDFEAAHYDEHEYPSDTQRQWVAQLVQALPPGSLILDAPCGTGKYFPMIAAAGHQVVGIDQSPGMLDQARRRGIATSLECMALHDLAFEQRFDAVLTIDAMENVPPEEWPGVVANLHRALRPGGLLYMTVEEIEAARLEEVFEALIHQGAPAVRGEVIEGDVAGYHYYPSRERVLEWFATQALQVLNEDLKWESAWGYRHFLLQRRL